VGVVALFATPAANTTANVAVQQLLSLDLVPALLARLLHLDAHPASTASAPSSQSSQGPTGGAEGSSRSSQGGTGGAEGSSQSTTAEPPTPASGPSSDSGVPPAKLSETDCFCSIVATITTALGGLLMHVPVGGRTAAGDGDLLLETIEQLLSSTAALKVAVHDGMSVEVQEAARAGSGAARECLSGVCLMLRQAAFALSMTTGAPELCRDGRAEVLSGQLAMFLQAEENLPFLEPLCLPPDHGKPLTVP
jgi:hypothetical protein